MKNFCIVLVLSLSWFLAGADILLPEPVKTGGMPLMEALAK